MTPDIRLIYSKELDEQSRRMSEIIYCNVRQVDLTNTFVWKSKADATRVTTQFRGYQRADKMHS